MSLKRRRPLSASDEQTLGVRGEGRLFNIAHISRIKNGSRAKGWRRGTAMMAHDSWEDRRLQHLAHAMAAQAKAEEATDTNIRDWWASVAEAWQRLADPPKIGN